MTTPEPMLQLPGAAAAAARMDDNEAHVGRALDSLGIPGFGRGDVIAAVTPTITATVLDLLPRRLTRKNAFVMRCVGRIYGIAAMLAIVAVEADRAHRPATAKWPR